MCKSAAMLGQRKRHSWPSVLWRGYVSMISRRKCIGRALIRDGVEKGLAWGCKTVSLGFRKQEIRHPLRRRIPKDGINRPLVPMPFDHFNGRPRASAIFSASNPAFSRALTLFAVVSVLVSAAAYLRAYSSCNCRFNSVIISFSY